MDQSKTLKRHCCKACSSSISTWLAHDHGDLIRSRDVFANGGKTKNQPQLQAHTACLDIHSPLSASPSCLTLQKIWGGAFGFAIYSAVLALSFLWAPVLNTPLGCRVATWIAQVQQWSTDKLSQTAGTLRQHANASRPAWPLTAMPGL